MVFGRRILTHEGRHVEGTLDELLLKAEEILESPNTHQYNPVLLLQLVVSLAYEFKDHKHQLELREGAKSGTSGYPEIKPRRRKKSEDG